jgi:hypothetical protein
MKAWYQAQKEVVQGAILLIPVMGIIIGVWYYRTFPAEYDNITLGGKTQIVSGRIIQLEVDTQLVQRRWQGNLKIRFKVHYQFQVQDSTYTGIQILSDTWKNKRWVQIQALQNEIPVEYRITEPKINRMIIEKTIK